MDKNKQANRGKRSIKSSLHTRNLHRQGYDFDALIKSYPDLAPHVKPNKYNNSSIDFFDPLPVKLLNAALLRHYYQIEYWDLPEDYLCPPVPGRADYVHNLADLLASINGGKPPIGKQVIGLDVGTGASLIYPILAHCAYGWSMIGSEVDDGALQSADNILRNNSKLNGHIGLRKQKDIGSIFKGIIKNDEQVDFVICNPPFYDSPESANKQSYRKYKNLNKNKNKLKFTRNFGGQPHELWCEGGEAAFVSRMIDESILYSRNCLFFTTLVSNEDNLPDIHQKLKRVKVQDCRTIEMSQGQKKSRIVTWSFKSGSEKQKWATKRWNRII